MKALMNRVRAAAMAIAVAGAMLLTTADALAEDVVRLKTGEVVKGEIIRELDGSIWVLVKIGTLEQERFFPASAIESVERDATPDVFDGDGVRKKKDDNAVKVGVPKGAVISLEGMVGMLMTADSIKSVIPDLERDLGTDGSGIVVFKINSGGGALLEIQKLSDAIQFDYKPRFRVVAWIDSAISAAAMTAHCIEEIYFMPEGNYGACTGWSGQLNAMGGLGFEYVLVMMEKISDRGGYDHTIMKAMQGNPNRAEFYPLSAHRDERGNVTWYQTEDGGQLINPAGRVLTFNSVVAEEWGFSRGTARNLDELAVLMREPEVEWIGEPYEGRIYPVSRAEAKVIRYREKAEEDQSRFNEYAALYNITVQAASGAPEESRGALVGRARGHLNKIKSAVRNNPNLALFQFNGEANYQAWLEEQEELLRRIAMGP